MMYRATPLLLALLIGVLGEGTAAAQTSDTTPPTLVQFAFTPSNVDVTAGGQNVTVTARATDDLSGAPFGIQVSFRSPSGAQTHFGYIPRVSGTMLDANYSGPITIPQFVEAGTWKAQVFLWDNVNNFTSLDSSNLAALGFPTDLDIVSTPDTNAPVAASAVWTPTAVDVSSADQTVTLDLRITDDVSGFDFSGSQVYYMAYLQSPSAGRYAISVRDFTQLSGTPLDGTYQLVWTIPQYSEAGTWQMVLDMRDNAGNRTFFDPVATFDVAASTQDLAPPALTALRFTPAVIDTSAGAAMVTVSMDLTDNLSGVDFSWQSPFGGHFHGMFFRSPSNAQLRSACCGQFNLTAGTPASGTWEATVFFPQFSEAGTWKASITGVSDHVRNFLNLTPDQLAAASLPTDLVVVRPSLEGDGAIGPGGGTVSDETFGSRATLILPAGAVGGTTDVAIDVFPDPLAIPNPSGFAGPGTYFVNVSLTPTPSFPFPAPGATMTLPLPNFLNPGSMLPLFFVEQATGTLQPAADVTTGAQVVGIVGADGLTATFTGISHFSIVVGLIPEIVESELAIDIKPGSTTNPVNMNSNGKIPVAILSTPTFNAVSGVVRSTLRFGKTGNEPSLSHCGDSGEDVNADLLMDLVCHFNTQSTGFAAGDTEGILRAETMAGETTVGTDSVQVK